MLAQIGLGMGRSARFALITALAIIAGISIAAFSPGGVLANEHDSLDADAPAVTTPAEQAEAPTPDAVADARKAFTLAVERALNGGETAAADERETYESALAWYNEQKSRPANERHSSYNSIAALKRTIDDTLKACQEAHGGTGDECVIYTSDPVVQPNVTVSVLAERIGAATYRFALDEHTPFAPSPRWATVTLEAGGDGQAVRGTELRLTNCTVARVGVSMSEDGVVEVMVATDRNHDTTWERNNPDKRFIRQEVPTERTLRSSGVDIAYTQQSADSRCGQDWMSAAGN